MFIPDQASTLESASTFRGLLNDVDAREISGEELWEMLRRHVPKGTAWAILVHYANATLSIRKPDDVPEWNTDWGEDSEWPATALLLATATTMQRLYAELMHAPYGTEDVRRRMAYHLEATRVAVFSDFAPRHLFTLLDNKRLLYQNDD